MGSGASRALLGAALAVAGVGLLYLLAFHTGAGLEEDERVLRSFLTSYAGATEDRAGTAVEFLNPLPFSIAVGIVLLGATLRRSLRLLLVVAAIFAGANVTTQVLQALTDVPRGGGLSPNTHWPSGHTCAATTLAMCVVLASPSRIRPAAALLATLGLLTIAFSILLIASHRLSDVLAGMLVGFAWTSAASSALPRTAPAHRGAPWACAIAALLAFGAFAALAVPAETPAIAGASITALLAGVLMAQVARIPAPVLTGLRRVR